MLTFTKGDLFNCGAQILVNTVNCVGVMGKGIALEFKKRYPQMFVAYRKRCLEETFIPGDLFIWDDVLVKIINFPTKDHWRNPSKYKYIEDGLKSLRTYLRGYSKETRIAIPPLGCGNGGLDWNIVKPMMELALEDLNCDIIIYEPT